MKNKLKRRMIICYRLLTVLTLILSPIILIYRLIKNKEHPKGLRRSFVFFTRKRKLIWFHGASVGELQSIIPIIEKLEKTQKDKSNFDYFKYFEFIKNNKYI